LSGNWQPNAINQNVDLAKSGVVIPELPWAAEQHKKNRENISKDDPEARCLPPGVPRMSTTPYPWSIIQTPKEIVIIYEGGAHIWRKIFMDGRGHNPDAVETWLGDSIGHWEGDTLVVETTNFTDKTQFRGSGENLKVTERFTRIPNGLLYRFTVEDPTTWSRPWTGEYDWNATTDQIYEYACHEGNHGLENVLRGARAEDQAR
jgi:hypothetical protein